MKSQSSASMFPANREDPLFRSLKKVLSGEAARPKILNPGRFREMMTAKKAIEAVLRECDGESNMSIHYHRVFSSASLCCEMDFLEIYDMAKFYAAMKYANNFEVLPLTNGKIRMAFTFHHMFITLEEEK